MGRMHDRLKLRKSWPGQPSFGQASDAAMFFSRAIDACVACLFLYKCFIVNVVPSCFDSRFFLPFFLSFLFLLIFSSMSDVYSCRIYYTQISSLGSLICSFLLFCLGRIVESTAVLYPLDRDISQYNAAMLI